MITRYKRPFELLNPVPDMTSLDTLKNKVDQEMMRNVNSYHKNGFFCKEVQGLNIQFDDKKSENIQSRKHLIRWVLSVLR